MSDLVLLSTSNCIVIMDPTARGKPFISLIPNARSSLENLQVITKGDVSLLEVPYSEHSSFSELKRFVKFLKLSSEADIIDTVSRRSEDRKRTKEVFKEWIS